MKIVIPMAGMGKRMRPFTLTTPKPLIPVAGKPMVEHLVNSICAASDFVDEVIFITGRFGTSVESKLIEIAAKSGAKGSIRYQDEPLGTAHALLCAEDVLSENVFIAFADTLFRADLKFDKNSDGTIWVHKVEDPSGFGVVITGENGFIDGFVEKPRNKVSDLAIIGIYYFKEAEVLRREMRHLLDNNITGNGEFQLTDALENMIKKGARLSTAVVDEWLDCGNKNATLFANQRLLETNIKNSTSHSSASINGTTMTQPCYIGAETMIDNSVIGPYVSIGDNCIIRDSTISNCIIENNTIIEQAHISNSMIGNHAYCSGNQKDASIGDYCIIK